MSKRPSLTDSRSERRPTVITVYTREGCHLCEEALAQIVALHGEGRRFDLIEVDIEGDERLLREMLEKIPVVEVDGERASELILDADALRARLDTVREADDRRDDRGAGRW